MELYTRTVDGKRIHYARCVYFDKAGKRKFRRKSTGIEDDGSKANYEAAYKIGQQHQGDIALGGGSPARKRGTSRTLQKAIADLIEAQELADKSAASIEIITEKAANLVLYFGSSRSMGSIDDDAVKGYATAARYGKGVFAPRPVAPGRKAPKRGRSIATVLRELLVLKMAFDAIGLEPPKMPDIGEPPPSQDRFLEVDEQRKLLVAISPKRRLNLLAYLQLGGMRKCEAEVVVEIKWDTRFAHVAGTKTEGSNRWVPIPDELFEAMLPYRDEWVGENLEGWLPRWLNVRRDLLVACKKAEIKPVGPNGLRRTYATHMARAGVDALQLAKLMGTSVKMLETVYARLEVLGDHQHAAVAKGVPVLNRQAAAKRAKAKTKAKKA